MGGGSRVAISVLGVVDPRVETASDPGISLVNLSVVPVAWRPLPLVFGVELAGLFKDPAVSVSMISWFVGVDVNLAGLVQDPV